MSTISEIREKYYTPTLKNGLNNRKLSEMPTQDSSCIIAISVGQMKHEGERLEITIDLLNQHFSSFVLMVGDTLQRYTLALQRHDVSADDMYEESLLRGTEWLERNHVYYSRLNNLESIIRWNDYLNNPELDEKIQYIKNSMAKNLAYQQSYDKTVDEFVERYRRRMVDEHILTPAKLARAKSLSLNYLIEECASMLIWPKSDYWFYVNRRNTAMAATYQRFILPHFARLCQFNGNNAGKGRSFARFTGHT